MPEPTLRDLSTSLDVLAQLMISGDARCERCQRFVNLRQVIDERDRQYTERDQAGKDAVKAALVSVERLADITAVGLKEYKASANEWRATVQDLIANLKESRSEHSGQSTGIHVVWGYLVGVIGLLVSLVSILALLRKL